MPVSNKMLDGLETLQTRSMYLTQNVRLSLSLFCDYCNVNSIEGPLYEADNPMEFYPNIHRQGTAEFSTKTSVASSKLCLENLIYFNAMNGKNTSSCNMPYVTFTQHIFFL